MSLFKKSKQPNEAPDNSLRNEKLKSSIIISAMAEGVLLVDAQRVIQLFNPAAEQITGWRADEAKGIDYRSVIQLLDNKGQNYPESSHPIAKIFTTGLPAKDTKATLHTKNNQRLSLDISVSPLIDGNSVSGAVVIFRDVSTERLEEQKRADFISTASHEMRTPVAAIEGYLALALNQNVSQIDAKARGFLEKAHASTKHLGELFQDLLTSAKAEDGRLSDHPAAVEMGGFMKSLAEDLRFVAEKKGLITEFVLGASGNPNIINAGGGSVNKIVKPLFYVYADPERLRELITNIFDNAVKYTSSGKITLGLTADDRVVQVHVADTGPGIPAEDIPHLFQKFYRVDNSATRTIGGTGLGLFICRKIAELYHGKIWVTSTLGKGSTFYINLPRLSSDKVALAQSSAQPVPPTLPKP